MKKMIVMVMIAMSAIVTAQEKSSSSQTATGENPSIIMKMAGQPVVYEIKLGTKTITVQQLESEFGAMPPQFEQYFRDPEKKDRYIQQMIDKEVFSVAAIERGMSNNPELRKKIEDYTTRLLYTEFLNQLFKDIKIEETDLQAYYEEHKDDFKTQERAKARHIMVKTEEEAIQVKKELDAGGRWDELAQKYSQDKSSAARGGDLGLFNRGRMENTFDEAVFSMKPGEIRGPVKTTYGFHIIALDEIQPVTIEPFEKVKDAVKNKMMNQAREEKLAKAREELSKKYNVQINMDAARSVQVKSKMPANQMMPPGAAAPQMNQPKKEEPEKK